MRVGAAIPLPLTIAIFAVAFCLAACPWLSGGVTIPWDAKSQFFPPVQFLATSIARGEWPWWTPNLFAGWPLITDPQSLLFSPIHVLLAASSPAVDIRAFDAVTFVYLFLGGLGVLMFFHDRGWHPAGGIVAAMAFALGGSASARIQHTIEIVSLAYLPLALWLVARALDRASAPTGVAAGLLIGLLALGRDQVALLSLYVIAAFIFTHWLTGPNWRARLRLSLTAVTAAAVTAACIAVLPVIQTVLLAAASNRPHIGYESAAAGSLHPVHFLQLVFADLYGAMRSNEHYWAPQSPIWDAAWGWPELYLSPNMGLLYGGALTFAVILAFGLVRGLAWAPEIRFFSIAAVLVLLYALGGYTPAFRLMYELLPGVSLFRRPADGSFVLGALLAVVAGYLVHRWLQGTVPPSSRLQCALDMACALILVGAALLLAHSVVGVRPALLPILTAVIFTCAGIAVLVMAQRANAHHPLAAVALITGLMTADLGWNNAPHVSTALPPARFDALRQDTGNATVQLIRSRLAAAAAPDRRDRVELIGIDYHWPNLPLAQDFDGVFGHNPLRLHSFYEATHVGDTVALASQRTFSPLYPSYHSAFADLLGLRFIATGVPVEEIDGSLKPSDVIFIGRTSDAYLYENPRALPRVMLLTHWRRADFNEVLRTGWPDLDPKRTVLLEHAPAGLPRVDAAGESGAARLLHYGNTEVVVAVDAPMPAILLLNDVWHPWWRASVDGVQTEILKANAIFRAVVVPSGAHVVRFSFHPFVGALRELLVKLTGQ
ncbi:MAG: hypothetical protein QOD29_1479 [Alphaproteobacteria bacterium]|nr:hypothetical protein [Alphaproteobacteria bacterium]